MEAAEHGHRIATYRDILAQTDRTEKVHNVVTDGRVVCCVYVAKEDDHVVPGLPRNMCIAEEDHQIMVDRAFGIHTAEEAHGIAHRLALGNDNVAAELNRILRCVCRLCGE